MKRVLILCYDYPPLVSIGANRPAAFFKHLHKYGIQTTVIARKWGEGILKGEDFSLSDTPGTIIENSPEGTLIRVPRTPNLRDGIQLRLGPNRLVALKKGLTFFEATAGWFIPMLDTKYFLYEAAEKYLETNSVDLILASGEPFCTFNYARKLSEKFNVPYILDYRDGWTGNYLNNHQMPLLRRIMLRVQRNVEKKCIEKAKLFISVSQPLVSKISEEFGQKSGIVIENGVELDVPESDDLSKGNETFKVLYTGTLYDVQLVNVFLDGFSLFYKNAGRPKNILLEWVGISLRFSNNVNLVNGFAHKLQDIVVVTPPENGELVRKKQRDAHVLISFIATSQSTGWMGGKTYEYAATGNPSIVIPTLPDRNTPFFLGRDIQHFCLTAEEVAERLEFFYEAYLSGKPYKTSITKEEIFLISRESEVKKLALKIHEVLA